MLTTTRATLARETIAKIALSDLDPHELLHEVSERVRTVVPYQLGGFAVLDQDTLIPTSCIGLRPAALMRDLVRNEVVTPDVHKFADVSRLVRPVVANHTQDGPDAKPSIRRDTIFAPLGFDGEARVVFRAHGSSWGGAGLVREQGDRPFDEDELTFLAEIADDVGHGLRRSLARGAGTVSEQRAPGVLIVDEQLHTISATGHAEHWRALMPPETEQAIEGTVLAAQGFPAGDSRRRARLRLTTGEWLSIHASPLETSGTNARLTAVTLEPVGLEERVRLMTRLHGLSPRERDVTQLVCAGRSTDEMATELFISQHTLRDHLKSIFAKVGVASRPALMATLSGSAAPGAF